MDFMDEVALLEARDKDAVSVANRARKFFPVAPVAILVDMSTWKRMERKGDIETLDGVYDLSIDDIAEKEVVFVPYEHTGEANEVVQLWLALMNDLICRYRIAG